MALTGIEIFKLLAKTNCKQCGFPTCLAFAMKLAAKQVSIDACPFVSDDVKAMLGEASAPPIRKITIGTGDNQLTVGEETVLFRHEKTFVHQPGFALRIEDTASAAEIEKQLADVAAATMERVGQKLKFSLIAVKNVSKDKDKYLSAIKLVQSKCNLPLILVASNTDIMAAALEITAAAKPLIAPANEENYPVMADLAKKHSCPLVVAHSGGLEKLNDLSEKVQALGVKDLVLHPGHQDLSTTLAQLTQIRRTALKKAAKGLGFPVLESAIVEGDNPLDELGRASLLVMKYAAIIILSSAEIGKMLPLFTLRQNIYTDPQQPLQVEEKVYKIGEPTADSPVIITTNFSLTYFIVASEIENSKVPTWLVIADAEGMSVLTAWAADKFNAAKISKVINSTGIGNQVKNRKLIIPGYVAVLSGEVAEVLPDWKIVVGPREAGNLPAFLRNFQ
ncbi:MAG: acetyl-CoA decarbonylase/synthase complex subunit gamma [Candidatus Schekmanbacteria bacterium]|nr:acetyl-CoA decarbonylase/synthase complex subunit gamma [Candidatus Schekmanbacteria bacterium]